MAHGFSATRRDGLEPYAERFTAGGLAVLAFDYRHFGDSGGEPRQLLDVRRQLDDWRAALRFARSHRNVDAARVALFGMSFSGGHVISIASEDYAISAVISQVPFLDGVRAMLDARPRWNALRGTWDGLQDLVGSLQGKPPRMIPVVGPPGSYAVLNAPEAVPGFDLIVGSGSKWRNEIPSRFVLSAPLYRPIKKAPQVAAPTLFCVAERDQTVSVDLVRKAAGLMPQAAVKVYACGHFEICSGPAFEKAVTDQLNFLKHHLRSASPLASQSSS
jgi:uncharacterized protein